MPQQVCVVLSAAEREQLVVIVADRNRPRKHVEPARIVLALGRSTLGAAGGAKHRHQPADGVAVATTLRQEWVEGLLRDKTRKSGKAPLAAETHSILFVYRKGGAVDRTYHLPGTADVQLSGTGVMLSTLPAGRNSPHAVYQLGALTIGARSRSPTHKPNIRPPRGA